MVRYTMQVKILEIQAQIEALVTDDGQACFHGPAIAIYNTLPVVTPDGGEYKANGDRKGLELSPF